ncbi:MAG: hypothetical protein PUE17_09390 [Bacteroidales bacterium]|nr:hypothetical protein [Bacteroidales bacterium]
MQGESNEKKSRRIFIFFAEPPPNFAKQSSARREQRKEKLNFSLCFSFFSRLALTFHNLGYGSAIQIENPAAFHFALLSPCTNFAAEKVI